MNKVILVGRICREIEVRQASDKAVARFGIAVDRKFKNANGEYETDFINTVAFGKTAEFIEKYFSKGMRIAVVGRIQTGSYTDKDGNKRSSFDVVIDEAEFCESKNAQGNTQTNSAPVNNSLPTDNDGFVSVTDDLANELPFC